MDPLKQGDELYNYYKDLKKALIKEKETNPKPRPDGRDGGDDSDSDDEAEKNIDHNVIAHNLAQFNMQFAVQYPVIIRTLAIHGLYSRSAFAQYIDFTKSRTVESLARKKAKSSGTDFDEMNTADQIKTKMHAQAMYNAKYTIFVAQEQAQRKNPRTWRENFKASGMQTKIISAELQQLEMSAEQARMAAAEVEQEQAEQLAEKRRFVANWCKRAAAFDETADLDTEIRRLQQPLAHSPGCGADIEVFGE